MNNIVKYLRNFGAGFTFKYGVSKLLHNETQELSVLKSYFDKHYVCDSIMNEKFNEWKQGIDREKANKTLWAFWWQGEDRIPEIVRLCIESQRKYAKRIGAKYIFLSKDNIFKYIDIPQHIINRLNNGEITITHFSDILRIQLLSDLGGAWIDSTVYIEESYNKDIFEYIFFSFHTDTFIHMPTGFGQKITQCKWAGFFLVSPFPNNPLLYYVRDSLFSYWENHDYIINYFIMNLLIRNIYMEIEEARIIIDDIPYNNNQLYSLEAHINEIFNKELWESILSTTGMFKLSWKKAYIKECDNMKTFYGYLINH